MTSMPQLQAMQWNFKDELLMTRRQAVNATDADGVLHQGERTFYVYDSSGQRTRKVTESTGGIKTKERFYLGGFEVYRQYDSGGAVTLERETLHVMDDKQRIALIETKTKDTSQPPTPNPQPLIRYQLSNHLGSASVDLDDTGQIISYEEYHPYGSTSYQAGRSAAEVSLKRYRYTGMERDEESGFEYHGARYFASWLGRWMNCDPISLGDGINLYRYSSSNPARFLDPTGTDATTKEQRDLARAERGLKRANQRLAAFLKTPEGAAALAAQTRLEAAKADLAKLQAQRAAKAKEVSAATALAEKTSAAASEAIKKQFGTEHSGYSDEELAHIDQALQKVTGKNQNLRDAFYRHYAHYRFTTTRFTYPPVRKGDVGATDQGDTYIASHLIDLEPNKNGQDPLSYLGEKMMHEYSHTPQGSNSLDPTNEAKAYGIELFFAENLNDEQASNSISTRYINDSVDTAKTRAIFNSSRYIMQELYKMIDKGGPDAEAASKMSVEFISRNEENYGPMLKAFIAKHPL